MKGLLANPRMAWFAFLSTVVMVAGCATVTDAPELPTASGDANYATRYKIAPGDTVQIFVWRNPEISTTVPVRPDGLISAPLLEELPAAGKTPAELARDVEKVLATYLRDPLVTIIVNQITGSYPEQIRIVGAAAKPQAILYKDAMTVLDAMITAGGLTKFADGNNATLVRAVEGKQQIYRVRLDDLLKRGDISANVDLRPGDILIIPESWF